MAYNPFDDVIENDPAYMQTGGELQRSVLPQRRVNYDQETFKPIATAISKGYKLLTPEQDTLEEIEKNKQLRELSTAQALRGTKFEEFAGQADLPSAVIQSPGIKERLDAAGYKPQGFIEGMSRTGQFFYGDQRQAYDKLASGQQLTDQDRTAIAMSPLDSLDFLFPPLLIKKLGSMGLKTVDDVLKSTADIQEVKQIKNYFGGQGFTPAGVVREADMGGSGGFTPRSGVSIEQQKRLKAQEEETLKLAEILKKDLDEDKNLTMQQLVEKYNLQGITPQGRKDLKKTSNEILKREVPELFKDRTSPKNRNIQKRKKGDEQLLDYLQKKRESGEKFESFSAIADDLVKLKETMPTLQVKNRKSLANRYNENPQFAELFDEIIDRPEKIQVASDRFQQAYNKVPLDNKLKLLGEETFKSINPEMFDSINRLSQVAGKEKGYSATNLFSRFLYDKYRSIKESDNPLGIVTEDDFFQKLKFTDQDVKDLKSEFSDYVTLERDRLYMQNEGLNFMNNLLDNPQYKPYLVNAKGEFDQKLFTVNKLHDVPLFQARKEGKGRLKKVGRFLNTGTDPEFLNPHFQHYNRLMVDLDPTLNKLADFLNQKGLMNQASKMDAKVIPKVKDKMGRLKTPDSRINFVTEGIVKLINDKGFNLDPTGKKQDVFLKEVAEAIDDIYKERGLRAVVPTLKGAKNESQIFGVENPKEIDLDTKIDQYKEALINALDYAVENNISPKILEQLQKKKGH
jgi:hypothetical protein